MYQQFENKKARDRALSRSKERKSGKLKEIQERKAEIMANIKAMREDDRIEEDLIAREHAQIVKDYMQYGQDYVLQQYHGGLALVNLLEGLKSTDPQEKAYWSKIGLDLTDKVEARRQKMLEREKPNTGEIQLIERVIVDVTRR